MSINLVISGFSGREQRESMQQNVSDMFTAMVLSIVQSGISEWIGQGALFRRYRKYVVKTTDSPEEKKMSSRSNDQALSLVLMI